MAWFKKTQIGNALPVQGNWRRNQSQVSRGTEMKKIAARDGAYDKRYVYRMTSRLGI